MNGDISQDLLAQLSEFLAARMGLDLPPARWPDLQRSIRAAAPELGFDDVEEGVRRLLDGPVLPHQIDILAAHLTVGETYFWREKQSLRALEEHILPPLVAARRQSGDKSLRFWSAGCCTGEEPYSIAMLLHQALPDWREWKLTITATDINPRFLQKAETGIYGEWSFRGVPARLKEKYFQKTPQGRYQIIPQIKKMVRFGTLNLVEDGYPSLANHTAVMDVILCRNVLIYLTAEQSRKVVAAFHRALVEGGWLIVSPSEASQTLFAAFDTENFPGAILYRKGDNRKGDNRKKDHRKDETKLREHTVPAHAALPDISQHLPVAVLPAPVERLAVKKPVAIQPIESAEAEPQSAPALLSQARAAADAGQLAQARECCERAIEQDKLHAAGYYLHAVILQEQGELEAAGKSLQRSLYLEPNFVLAHYGLGNLAFQSGKTKDAQKHFATALALLQTHRPEEELPESEGITAGRLTEVITSLMQNVEP